MVAPYKLIGKSELNKLNDTLRQCFDAWMSKWFLDGAYSASMQLEVIRDYKSLPQMIGRRIYACSVNESLIDIIIETKAINLLLAGILNIKPGLLPDTLTGMTKDLIEKCLQDFIASILNKYGHANTQLNLIETDDDPEYTAIGDSLQVLIKSDTSKYYVLIPTILFDIKKPSQTSINNAQLTKRSSCKFVDRTKLSVLAGRAELDFGTLSNLNIGDVVRLDSRIEDPMTVITQDNTYVCSAYIGKSNGKKVAKIILKSR